MKKLLLLSFFILFVVYSCSSTINRPLYSKSDNAKELILSKYGKPSKVENLEEKKYGDMTIVVSLRAIEL